MSTEQEQVQEEVKPFNPDIFMSDEDENVDDINQDDGNDDGNDGDNNDQDGQGENVDLESDWDAVSTENEPEELSEEDKSRLAAINEFMGTDFKTLEEAKENRDKSSGTEEAEDEPNVTETVDELRKMLDEDEVKKLETINYFKGLSNDDLILSDIKQDMIDAGIVEKDEEGKYQFDEDDLNFELDEIKSRKANYAARIRKIKSSLKLNEDRIVNAAKERLSEHKKTKSEKAVSNKKELQAELKKLSTFMGAEVPTQFLHKAYKGVTSGSFFDEVMSTQENIAQLSLLWELREQLPNMIGEKKFTEGKLATFQKVTSSPGSSGGSAQPGQQSGFNPTRFLEDD